MTPPDLSPHPAAALEVRHVSKTFPGQTALDDVSVAFAAGEIHGLVGENGSGKSTLVKILDGFHRPDPGSAATLDGDVADLDDAQAPWRRRLHVIHQELGLVPDLSILENVALGAGYGTRALGRIRWRHQRARVAALLDRFGLRADPRTLVRDLGPAERTVVAMARALQDWTPDWNLLVLDEPTAALHAREVELLFEVVARVRAEGAGVVFISHRLDEVLRFCDRVSVLRDGCLVASRTTDELRPDELAELIVGSAAPSHLRRRDASPDGSALDPDEPPILTVRGMTGSRLHGVDVSVRRNEVVGVAGLLGSGREELASSVFGAVPVSAARVECDGRRVRAGSPRDAITAGMALVPADRREKGCIPEFSVRENVTLPRLGPLWRSGRLDRGREDVEVTYWIDQLQVRPRTVDQLVANLSGGNQQKVVLARWLRTTPKVLLLEEPTQGVDVGAKAQIHGLIRQAAHDGIAVLVTSSEAAELAEIADRVIVLRDGQVGVELTAGDISEQRILTECSLDHDVRAPA